MKTKDELVIAGISGRFPESNSFTEFRNNLLNGVDTEMEDFSPHLSENGNVGCWTKYFPEYHKSLRIGDIIECDRGVYSHWALYTGSNQATHFHMKSPTGKVVIDDYCKFQPGIVSTHQLSEVARSSRIRVNNKSGPVTEWAPRVNIDPVRRPLDDLFNIINIVTDKPGFEYSIQYFNCENYVRYLRFVGDASSTQISRLNTMRTIMGETQYRFVYHQHEITSLPIDVLEERIRQDQISKSIGKEAQFNALAYSQWIEYCKACKENRTPQQVMQHGVDELTADEKELLEAFEEA